MPDDVFRILITVAVALAGVAFLVQAGLMIALYRAVSGTHRKMVPLVEQIQAVVAVVQPTAAKARSEMERAKPTIEDAAHLFDSLTQGLDTAEKFLAESRPRIVEAATHTAAAAKDLRTEVERIGKLVEETSDHFRERLARIDGSVDQTLGYLKTGSARVKRAALAPIREANGLASGTSAAISALVRRPKLPGR